MFIIFLLIFYTFAPLAVADPVCDGVTKVFVDTEIREYSVLISTHVHTNTSFIVEDGMTVTVTDAPRSLSFVTSGRSTKKVTNTVPFGVDYTDSAGTIHKSSPFVLRLSALSLSKRSSGDQKRQSKKRQQDAIGFVGMGGTLSTTCSAANSYTLTASQLLGLTVYIQGRMGHLTTLKVDPALSHISHKEE